MTLRPAGSKEARVLFECTDLSLWTQCLSVYPEAISLRADQAPLTTTKGLIPLDLWWREELPSIVAKKYITSQELCRVVEWKIKRGKFRPLMGLVQRNDDATVRKVTKAAFEMTDDEAIQHLADGLAGVGPATASAVLAFRGSCPFMSDEALEGSGLSRKYTIKNYQNFAAALKLKADFLGGNWTAELVGRALWAHATITALQSSSRKRTRNDDGSQLDCTAAKEKGATKRKAPRKP